jgi:hypothetical protein
LQIAEIEQFLRDAKGRLQEAPWEKMFDYINPLHLSSQSQNVPK